MISIDHTELSDETGRTAIDNFTSGNENRAPVVRATLNREQGLSNLANQSKNIRWEIAASGVAVTSNVSLIPCHSLTGKLEDVRSQEDLCCKCS